MKFDRFRSLFLLVALAPFLGRVRGVGRAIGAALGCRPSFPRIARVAAVGAALLVLTAGPAAAAPFDGLASAIKEAGQIWAPALFVLGCLIIGSSVASGHHQSGEKVRGLLIGGVLLAIAASGGGILESLKQYVGN